MYLPEILHPEDWYRGTNHDGCYLWDPPPGAVAAAVEEMGRAIHKRPYTLHMMIIPRFLTSRWRKQLGKTIDLMFEISAGLDIWSINQHEPLICCLYLSLSLSFLWRYRNKENMAGTGRILSNVWKVPGTNTGTLLCKLCMGAWMVRELPMCVVRKVLHSK